MAEILEGLLQKQKIGPQKAMRLVQGALSQREVPISTAEENRLCALGNTLKLNGPIPPMSKGKQPPFGPNGPKGPLGPNR